MAETDLVQRFVDFLNMDIASTAQVEGHWRDAMMVKDLMWIEAEKVDDYRADQAGFRTVLRPLADAFDWLGQVRRTHARANRLANVLRRRLEELGPFPARATFERGRLDFAFGPHGVVLCGWLATALLIDRHRGLLGRFGRCAHCGRFHVTFKGKPVRHCRKHAKAAQLARGRVRVRKWRRERAAARRRRLNSRPMAS